VTTSEKFEWGKDQWDLIVITYVGMRNLTDKIWESLRPGGVVLIESFHSDSAYFRILGPERWSDNELLTLFSKFRVIHYEDTMDRQDWGTQYGAKNRLVRLLAEKPGPKPGQCEFEGKSYDHGNGPPGMKTMICMPNGWKFTAR
jgi:hypothetical protein